MVTGDSTLPEAYPASFAQQRLWFVEQLVPGTPQHNVARCYRVQDGTVDVEALRQAITAVVARHESLRTSFGTADGAPVQIVVPTAEPTVEVIDTEDVRRALHAFECEPFDLSRPPLVRVALIRGTEGSVLAFVLHHLVADGWSMGVLVTEISEFYRAALDGTVPGLDQPPLQYVDFTIWQRAQAESADAAWQLRAYADELAGVPHLLELPYDRPRPAVPSFVGAVHRFDIPAETVSALERLAQRSGATLYMAMLAAWFLVLSRWSGASDLLVGTPVAGRTRSETEELIGFFANTLVLRGDLTGDPRAEELLERVRDRCIAAFSRQDVPFERLVEELAPERSLGHNPLVQVMFGWQNTPAGRLELPGARLAAEDLETATAQVDLTVDLTPATDGRLTGEIFYSTELFDARTAHRLAEHLGTAAAELARDPGRRVSEIDILGPAERADLLRLGAGREPAGPPEPLPQRIRRNVGTHPHRVAVTDADGSWSYRELLQHADAVAATLLRLGAGRGDQVAVCLPRSRFMVSTLLGVWTAGAAYVPLDPGYPQARLAFMAEDSGSRLLLTTKELADTLPFADWTGPGPDAAVVFVEDLSPSGSAAPDLQPARPEDLAYTMYTSGSTGQPKGVLIEHRGLANQIDSFADALGLSEGDRMLALTSMSFDPAWLELFLPLVVGGVVVVTGSDTARDPERLHAVLCDQEVTIAQATPTTWRLYCDHADTPPPQLRQVLTGGEELSTALAGRLLRLGVRVHNVYGPTETTVWATRAEITDPATVSIGRPIDRTRVFVVDAAGGLAPIGAVGELWIAGAGVARGFTDSSATAAGRFATAPDGTRAYRTGDLARWNPDGTLRFLGRADHQVKIRGHRIELDEIDAVLRSHPAIGDSLTAVRTDASGERLLVTAVVPDPADAPPDDLTREAREWARGRLPDHMVPRRVLTLSSLPRTPSGKSDRQAVARLAEPDTVVGGHAPPADGLQRELHDVWCDVLGVPSVSVAENIFDLGATSLTTVRVKQELSRRYGIDVPLTDFFAYPSIAALAVRAGATGGPPTRSPAAQRRSMQETAARRRGARTGGRP
ncbi:amino acid adenylation domain-containing protein [Nonomuraea sp. NPDC046802]|uniref:non-ribosomal peptide synthetase n=1 Tax=Nonomuraea sp. NPDC046802 TaxID=3154919 RepID=UPI0033E4FBB6